MISIAQDNLFVSQDYNNFLEGNVKVASGSNVGNIILATLRAMMATRENKKLTFQSSFGGFPIETEDLFILTSTNVTEVPEGWDKLEDVGVFLSTDKNTTQVFINKEKRQSIVSSPRVTSSIMAARITCVLPRLLPWMFDDGLTELDRRILMAINKDDSAAYNAAIEEIVEKLDIRTMKIKASLAGFESKGQDRKIQNLERNVNDHRNRLERLMRDFNEENRMLNEQMMVLSALRNHMHKEENENELMEFFLGCKTLELVKVDGLNMTFVVKTFLNQYDEDYFETLVSNRHTILYERGHNYDDDIFEKFLRCIFETNEIKLRVWASFTLTGDGQVMREHGNNGSVSVNGYLAHPHMIRFNCDGDNGKFIQQRLLENNYVAAVAQCISATSNLNFYDSTVLGELLEDKLSGDSKEKFLELPDGSVVSVDEAIEWIKGGKK
ncbi:MAG: hypothetical protein IIW69_03460 [Bacteroidaceae bacterium]|nr:hypothetical protein [Bacteroidaceae bacterium]